MICITYETIFLAFHQDFINYKDSYLIKLLEKDTKILHVGGFTEFGF